MGRTQLGGEETGTSAAADDLLSALATYQKEKSSVKLAKVDQEKYLPP